MLSKNDLFTEINWMEEHCNKMKDSPEKALLKAEILQLKLMQNIRTNMVSIMDHLKIPLVKTSRRTEIVDKQ